MSLRPFTLDFTYIFIFGFALLVLILGIIISVPINHWYTKYFVDSEDDVSSHMRFYLFIVIPLLFVIGGLIGNIIYRKRNKENEIVS